jgi:hypothetical protein
MRIKSLFIIIYSFKVQNMHSLQTERLMSLHVWLCLEGTPVTQKRGPGLLINRTILCIFILLSYLEVSSSFFSATQIQTHRHTHTHMHVCIYLCTHVHTYAHIITFTHTHTHTHTHTYLQNSEWEGNTQNCEVKAMSKAGKKGAPSPLPQQSEE